jgi:hypothetical protein
MVLWLNFGRVENKKCATVVVDMKIMMENAGRMVALKDVIIPHLMMMKQKKKQKKYLLIKETVMIDIFKNVFVPIFIALFIYWILWMWLWDLILKIKFSKIIKKILLIIFRIISVIGISISVLMAYIDPNYRPVVISVLGSNVIIIAFFAYIEHRTEVNNESNS